MRFFSRFVAVLALLAAFVAPALAEDLTAEQDAALKARIAEFDTAMRTSDMSTVLGFIPPAVLAQIATNYSVTTADLITSAQQQIDEALKTISIVSYGMTPDEGEAFTLADGTTYVLVPTETVMDLGEAVGKMRSTTVTVALLDDDVWYLMAVDDPEQIGVLKQVYPAFADVAFAPAKMEAVE